MGEIDGRREAARLRKKRAVERAASLAFFGASAVFLICYLSLPQSRAGSVSFAFPLKGVQTLKDPSSPGGETVLDVDGVLDGMGLSEGVYNAFVDPQKAQENLSKAPFVALSDEIPVVVSPSPFGLSVSFADLFPIVSVGGRNVLTDGAFYPESGGDARAVFLRENYPSSQGLKVPFADPDDDLLASVPPLFYAFPILENAGLLGVRYDGVDASYLFYWKSQAGTNLRIRVAKDLLSTFGGGDYLSRFGTVTAGDFQGEGWAEVQDPFASAFEPGAPTSWYPLEFKENRSAGLFHADYDRK